MQALTAQTMTVFGALEKVIAAIRLQDATLEEVINTLVPTVLGESVDRPLQIAAVAPLQVPSPPQLRGRALYCDM